MGNEYRQEITAWSFLQDPEAVTVYREVDSELRNGRHIQNWKKQQDCFRFVERNFDSLRLFYGSYFPLNLVEEGETINKYYFLEFPVDNRKGVPQENRHFLPNEYLIIGFMIFKIIFIDGYLELESITALQKMIRQDYEELKPGLYKVLAKAKKANITQMDEGKVDEIILKALGAFEDLGWMELDDQVFYPLASFQRLPKLYGDYINNLDNWLKTAL
jgi:hypothetical protein